MTDDDVRYVMNILRKGTITWQGRKDCMKKSRKLVREDLPNGNFKNKYYWQCAICEEWFRNEHEIEVDHIVEIGGFKGDWNAIVNSMYCGQDNLRCLCISCHQQKTAKSNATRMFKRKTDL